MHIICLLVVVIILLTVLLGYFSYSNYDTSLNIMYKIWDKTIEKISVRNEDQKDETGQIKKKTWKTTSNKWNY